jgi:hypothetical protein
LSIFSEKVSQHQPAFDLSPEDQKPKDNRQLGKV